jgi:hypothetical protein
MFAREHPHSLAATRTGQTVEIRRILFQGLREHCSDLDIHEGDVLRCRADTASQLILETTHGRTVALQRDWARFIEVVPDIPLPVQS